jgi:hypothetical protein
MSFQYFMSHIEFMKFYQNHWSLIHIDLGRLDPDAGGQRGSTKIGKSSEISYYQLLDVIFFFEG